MNDIDLTQVAPDLLQVVSLSLPTIAIFVTLGSGREGRRGYEVTSFYISLASLLLVVLAAGFNVGYLAVYQRNWVLYVAIASYLLSLVLLGISTGWMLIGPIRRRYQSSRRLS
jgi:hypothetical protein